MKRMLIAATAALAALIATATPVLSGIVISVKPVPAIPHGWKTYTDAKLGFSISYPADWRIDRSYVFTGFGPDHDIHGVAFTIPQSLAKGTNLSPNMTNVSVETVSGPGACDATRFLPDPQDLRTLKNAGRTWSTANAQDAGAGNFYDIAVFALPGSKPCLAVRYFIHSTNIGNYDPGTVKAFDRVGLVKTFATIRRTLRLKGDR
jgi:hypothetical protein